MNEMGNGLVDIVLVDAGIRPIPIYEMIRGFTGLNVKQARKLVDAPPQAIITQVPRSQAEALKLELEGFGATLELREAGAPGRSDRPAPLITMPVRTAAAVIVVGPKSRGGGEARFRGQ